MCHARRMRTRLPSSLVNDPSTAWALPLGSIFWFLATHLSEIATEELVGGVFHERLGRPSIAPEHLLAILLLRYFDNVSYEVAAQRARYDIRWKAVLGCAAAEEGPVVSDTTLNDFEKALRKEGRFEVLLKRTIQMASDAGWLQGELEVAQDSSPVIGKGAVKDTYNLLGDAIRKLVRGLAKAQGETPLLAAKRYGVEELFRRSTKATAQIDWADPEARRGFLPAPGRQGARADRQGRSARAVGAGAARGGGGGARAEDPRAGH